MKRLFIVFLSFITALAFADDIDIYVGANVAVETDGGNKSALTFLLDSSGSMSFKMYNGNTVSYSNTQDFYNHGERRTIMKNAFIDYVSSAPSDLKVGFFDYGGQIEDTNILSDRGSDNTQAVEVSGDTELESGIVEIDANNVRYFRCNDEDYDLSVHCDKGNPRFKRYNGDDFTFLSKHYARAGLVHFELPDDPAYKDQKITRIYWQDMDEQAGQNIELLIKVYEDFSGSTSNSNGLEAFNVGSPSGDELARFEVNLLDNIYEFDAAALNAVADLLEDDALDELSFIILAKQPYDSSRNSRVDLDSDDLQLVIEFESEDENSSVDGAVTSTLLSMGSDVLETSSGDTFDINVSDPNTDSGMDMEPLVLSGDNKVAFRFMLLPFDSTNVSAIDAMTLRLVPRATASNAENIVLKISLADGSDVIPVFDSSISNMLASATAQATVTIPGGQWVEGQAVDIELPAAIAVAIKAQFEAADWNYQDALTLILEKTSGPSLEISSYEESHQVGLESCPGVSYVMEAHNGDRTFCDLGIAAKLEFALENTASEFSAMKQTHREKVILSASRFDSGGGTPISPSYINIANYYKNSNSPLEDVGSKGCGIPDAIVMLTDGQETSGSDPRNSFYSYFPSNSPADIGSCSRSSTSGSNYQYWDCSNKLAQGLKSQGVVVDNQDYQIRSYGILFGPKVVGGGPSNPSTAYDYLTRFAIEAETQTVDENGNDAAYSAQTGYELVVVFKEIEESVRFRSVSAFTPNVSPGSASSFESSDELFYPLFKPDATVRWPGNLKRYSFFDKSTDPDVSDFKVVDVNLDPVYEELDNTNTFTIIKDSAWSWWSSEVDGSEVTRGGAAGKNQAGTRSILTYIPTEVGFDNVDLSLNPVSATIPLPYWFEASTPVGITDVATYLTNLVNTAQQSWGAMIHNLPLLANQQRQFDDKGYLTGSINTIYAGDNAGFMHAINTGGPTSASSVTNKINGGGNELWSFMPVELLPNMPRLFDHINTLAGAIDPDYRNRYVYGVDGHSVLNAMDKNRDGDYLDANDKLHLYFGLRRGGSAYYGLDVADSYEGGANKPKLLFRLYNTYSTDIAGAESATNRRLDRLAETWSPIEVAKIRWQGDVRTVLIFGGGYDSDANELQDSDFPDTVPTPQMGNAIYIVDAQTGEILTYISSVVTDSTKGVSYSDMKYSIPGRVAVVDMGNDGADLLYATDMGGNVFRVILDPLAGLKDENDSDQDGNTTEILSIVQDVTTMGQFGREVASSTTAKRVFFSGPVVTFIEGGRMHNDLAVVLSSGFVPELRDAQVEDMVITLFEDDLFRYGPQPITTPYTLSNLVTIDAQNAVYEYTNDSLFNQINGDASLVGWAMPLNRSNAEKVTGEPKIVKERLFLTTFSLDNPDQDDQCSIAVGQSNSYAMYLDGTAIFSKGRVINESPGFSTTGSVIKNVKDSTDTYFLFGTESVCLDGNCSKLQLDTPPTDVLATFSTDTESLIRTKWRQCMDSSFNECGADLN